MKNLICMLVLALLTTGTYSQFVSPETGDKLAVILNENSSKNIQFTFKGNTAILKIGELEKELDLRHSKEIATDSVLDENIRIKPNKAKVAKGDMYWQYSFDTAIRSKASFKANKSGKLFFTLRFPENDTLNIKSHLNQYASHHRLSDSEAHEVFWSGEKYISVLLQPKKAMDTVHFEVSGVTISGKFGRKDLKPIAKDYTKTLMGILKREFKLLFGALALTLDAKQGSYPISSRN